MGDVVSCVLPDRSWRVVPGDLVIAIEVAAVEAWGSESVRERVTGAPTPETTSDSVVDVISSLPTAESLRRVTLAEMLSMMEGLVPIQRMSEPSRLISRRVENPRIADWTKLRVTEKRWMLPNVHTRRRYVQPSDISSLLSRRPRYDSFVPIPRDVVSGLASAPCSESKKRRSSTSTISTAHLVSSVCPPRIDLGGLMSTAMRRVRPSALDGLSFMPVPVPESDAGSSPEYEGAARYSRSPPLRRWCLRREEDGGDDARDTKLLVEGSGAGGAEAELRRARAATEGRYWGSNAAGMAITSGFASLLGLGLNSGVGSAAAEGMFGGDGARIGISTLTSAVVPGWGATMGVGGNGNEAAEGSGTVPERPWT